MKINASKIEKIEAAIEKIEKGCRARLFRIARIEEAIEAAEEKLNSLGLYKKEWLDCSIFFATEKMPNAYQGRAEGTEMVVKRFASGWFVTDISREVCKRRAGGGCVSEHLGLSMDARKAITGFEL